VLERGFGLPRKRARQIASKRAEVARYFGVLGKPRGARVSASRHAEKDLCVERDASHRVEKSGKRKRNET
jgi:hypothetical protein